MTVIAPWQDLLAPTLRPTAGVPALVLNSFMSQHDSHAAAVPLHRWLAALWHNKDLRLWDAGAGNG